MKNTLRSVAVAASVIVCLAAGAVPANASVSVSGQPALGSHAAKGGASPTAVFPEDFLCKLFRSC